MVGFTRRTALAAGAGLALAAPARLGRAQPPTRIRFSGSAAVARADQGFMFLGIPAGFYRELGIEAEFVTIAGSAASIQLVAADQAQLAHVGMMELIAAKQRNPRLPVRAVYLTDVRSGYEIVVPEASRFRTIQDLRGQKIGVLSLASGAVPFVRAMLRQNGVNPAEVELLPVGVGAQALAALRTDRVQALSLFRGSHAAIENLGVQFRYFTVPMPSSVLAVNDGLLRRNPQAVTRALQGVVMNTAYLQTNPEAGVRRFWDLHGRPSANEARALEESAHLVRRSAELWKQPDEPQPWGAMNDDTWRSLIDYIGDREFALGDGRFEALYTAELIPEINRVDIRPAQEAARRG